MTKVRRPLRAIREYCVECSGGSSKSLAYCTCDGAHSTWCPLWPYRFGVRPKTAVRKYGKQFVMPALMPEAEVSLEELPAKVLDTEPEPVGV